MDARKLDEMMSMDHVVLVMENGVVMDHLGSISAPTCLDGELDSTKWELWSYGYTGQHGIGNTPWMHNSEYIGGRMEEDILSSPGVYCAIPCLHNGTDEDDEEIVMEGWTVVKLRETEDEGSFL